MTVLPPPPPPVPPPRPTPEKPSRTALIIGLIAGAGLLAAALVVVGVLSSAGNHAAQANPTPAAVEPDPTTVAPPTLDYPPPGVMDDAPASPPLSATVAEFGDTWTWEDGVSVSVVSAMPYEVGQYATGVQTGQIGVIVTVTVTNGTTTILDLDLCRVDLRAGDTGLIASRIDDPDNVGEQLGGILAPGQVATGEVAFGVDPANVGKVDIAVTPTMDYETALFSGVPA